MYKKNSQLKQEARQALSKKWGVAVVMALFTTTISYSLNMGDPDSGAILITSLISTLVGIILNVGFLSFFLKLCCGQKNDAGFKDLFYGFQCHPGKALLLALLSILYLLPGTFIYLILNIAIIFGLFTSSGISLDTMLSAPVDMAPAAGIGFIIAFIILTILYIVYAVYIDTTYCLVFYLLLDYPDLSVTEIWKRSAQLMKGNRLRKVGLDISFFPWILASAITLFIGILWVEAYSKATYTCFYLDIVQNQVAKAQPNVSSVVEPVEHIGIDTNTFN